MALDRKPRVVVVGAGFGGLWAARALSKGPVDVMVVDRNNYHTFLPLLYQVAAAELGSDQTVNPVRSILRALPNVQFTMAEVLRVDADRGVLECRDREIPYDYLVLAAGSTPHFMGVSGAEENAFSLRSLEDGLALRNHVLSCFEKAASTPDVGERERLMTFVIVGGGPTGVEFAGALAELFYGPLRKDFPAIDFRQVRLVLVEAGERLLASMPENLGEYALRRLRKKGIEVRLHTAVSRVTSEVAEIKEGPTIPTKSVVWTAGHRGHPLAEASGLPTNRRGQVPVLPTLQLSGHSNVYAIGDMACLEQNQQPLPMVAPVAMQGGGMVARNILRQEAGQAPLPFRYNDKGMLAVIGRNAGVAQLGKRTFTGFPAWLLWLGFHLVKLIGFRNRLVVLINWGWDYLFYERAVRLILPGEPHRWRLGTKDEEKTRGEVS